ncbi:VTT domain-containing protein [Lapidilactobacillus dextrinicus]|uniref:VTT domain-containing protein n=1 Tax=Lapidilactobacillus dextrinicus TaxID=51664 RepID=UPI003F22D0B7
MNFLIDFILHIDEHLVTIVNQFGDWTYLILFAIIFIETGAVILPFLPGDSLLFAAAALAANPAYHLHIWLFVVLFLIACLAGDSLNFYLGRNVEKLLQHSKLFSRLLDKDSLEKGREFFEKHGAIAIILARFMPIIRTFVPFVAAGSGFEYRRFIKYNWTACVAWVALCCGAGYFFGNLPFVKAHFSAIILAIIVVTLIPAVVGFIKTKMGSKKVAQ